MEMQEIARKKIAEFIDALRVHDMYRLEANFGVSAAMFEEIAETVQRVYDGGIDEAKLTVPDATEKLAPDNRDAIEVFERDSPANERAVKTWGIECHLLSDNKPSDLTLLADIYTTDSGEYELQFNMIEVQ
jgi:hypothetical protein